MSVNDQIEHIELKVRQLALTLERLRQENDDFRTENERLKAELDRQRGTTDALKDKLEKTQGVLDQQKENTSAHAQQLRQQLDDYIREIDKCIEWLHQY